MCVPCNKALTLMLSSKQIAEDTTDHGLDVSNEWSQVNGQKMTPMHKNFWPDELVFGKLLEGRRCCCFC